MGRTRKHVLCFLASFLLLMPTSPGWSAEFWLAAVAHAQEGYVQFLEERPLWKFASQNITVFQVYITFIDKVTDSRLRTMIVNLKAAGVKLAIATSVLQTKTGCDFREAQVSSPELLQGFKRIHDLGGIVDYVVMDEPVWFGSSGQLIPNCAMTGAQLAASTATTLSFIKSLFPEILFGDVEPTTTSPAAMQDFFAALAQGFGESVSFVHADVIWTKRSAGAVLGKDWQADLRNFRTAVSGLQTFGVVLDGGSWTGSNVEWEAAALKRFDEIRALVDTDKDRIIFQSWERFPDKYLPETEPGTMVHFVNAVMKEILRQ